GKGGGGNPPFPGLRPVPAAPARALGPARRPVQPVPPAREPLSRCVMLRPASSLPPQGPMAQLETGISTAAARQRATAPSVLVILVTKDGAAWLPQCLSALSRQTHPRLGVLAIDNGSSDPSADVLESALGADRVIRRSGRGGFAGALAEALQSDIAGQADYALFLHDDTLLAPDAVGAMVEAAERIDGTGVVGPKVLDWEQPRVLREIGLSTDR